MGNPLVAAAGSSKRKRESCVPEIKFSDVSKSLTSLTHNSITGCEFDPSGNAINNVPQGHGDYERVGRSYRIVRLQLKGTLERPAYSTTTPGHLDAAKVQLDLVLDTQTNKSQLNSEDYFAFGSSVADNLPDPVYSTRFDTMWSKTFVFDAPQTLVTYAGTAYQSFEQVRHFEIDMPMDIVVTSTGTSGGVTSQIDNSLHLLGTCSQVTSTSTAVKIVYNARVSFVDC